MFLGHMVSVKGIYIDLRKIEAILGWIQTKNVPKIQRFLGLVLYYCKFVEGFSQIIAPLTKLLRNNVSFKWMGDQQASFEKLKPVLTQALVLIQLELGKKYVLYNNASYTSLGCAVTYVSRDELEAKKVDRIVKGHNCVIEYHPRKANVVADALSRKYISDLRAILVDDGGLLAEQQVKPTLFSEIKVKDEKIEDFGFNADGFLCFRGRSRFWKKLHEALSTPLDFSTTLHLQIDGQSEQVIPILKDMFRGCIIEFQGSWEEHLPLVEFSYNKSFHSSIQMIPYEALYGRKYRTPLCWTALGERKIWVPKWYRSLRGRLD
ncbi:Retrovirus-related Pol polyprotein from transposon 17.6 [Gossypium australe]|uniref:Retrovirus-related Pol polyprotein from transposon 17.6 n=1 Tax=Gossypium australe TaxID=47621 RepID=A0A5B6WJT6_9ROSI|nr:Retrovirus-related Pol polyprotein from transposon 17.6 [Gossypium australe]